MTGVSLVKIARNGRPALAVTWTAPQSNVTISNYVVHYRRNGTTDWSSYTTMAGSPPATSAILVGLQPGTDYNVRVRAEIDHKQEVYMWSAEHTERTFDSECVYIMCIICCHQVHGHLWHMTFYCYNIYCCEPVGL